MKIFRGRQCAILSSGRIRRWGNNKILGCHPWNLSCSWVPDVWDLMRCLAGDRCGSHSDTFHISNSRVHHRSVLAIHHTRSSLHTKTCFHHRTCFFSPQHAHCAYPRGVTVFRRWNCGKRESNQCKEMIGTERQNDRKRDKKENMEKVGTKTEGRKEGCTIGSVWKGGGCCRASAPQKSVNRCFSFNL